MIFSSSTRREFPSIFPDERKTLKSKLPIQCNPQLAFHHRKSLAAESSRAYSIDSRTSAEAASAAADLYGVDSGEGRGSDDIEPLRTDGIHDDSIPGMLADGCIAVCSFVCFII
jgi:hypothetical protein